MTDQLIVKRRCRERALALQPLIDDVQDALDVLQVLHEEGFCAGAACQVLLGEVENLADAMGVSLKFSPDELCALLIAQAAQMETLKKENEDLRSRVAPLKAGADGQELPQSGNGAQPSLPSGSARANWQPIETAPKDGRDVLICYEAASGMRVTLGRWKEHGFNGVVKRWWQSDVGDVPATHWLPLPAPPVQETGHPPSRFLAVDPVEGAGTDGLRAQLRDLQTQLVAQAAQVETLKQEIEDGNAAVIAQVNARMLDDLIAPRLAAQAAHLAQIQKENDDLRARLAGPGGVNWLS